MKHVWKGISLSMLDLSADNAYQRTSYIWKVPKIAVASIILKWKKHFEERGVCGVNVFRKCSSILGLALNEILTEITMVTTQSFQDSRFMVLL